ncbi:hypothetical protein [Paenibacillus herberti]|nr:hypothetical protein [Paenibacillus herberti]
MLRAALRHIANWREVRLSGTSGAVTVWTCMIVSGVLLLMALLIDFSRIAAFNYKLDSMAQSSVRSVLSAYDEALYEQYGLFGRGGSSAEELLETAVSGSLGGQGSTGSSTGGVEQKRNLDMIQMSIDNKSIQPALKLGEWSVFRRQVEQEMKYKGPIDLTIELFDKFRPLAQSMEQTAGAVDTLQNAEKIFDKRQSALEKMINHVEAASVLAKETGADNLVPLSGAGTRAGTNAVDFATVAGGYSSYLGWIALDKAATAAYEAAVQAIPPPLSGVSSVLPPPPELNSVLIQQYETDAGDVAGRLLDLAAAADQHQRLVEQGVVQLKLALQEEKALEALAAKPSGSSSGNRALPGEAANGKTPDSRVAVPSIGADIADASSLLLGRPWFQEIEQDLTKQAERFRLFAADARSAGNRLEDALQQRNPALIPLLQGDVADLQERLSLYWRAYVEPGQELEQLRSKVMNADSGKELRAAEKKKAASLWKQARELLDGFNSLKAAEAELKEFQKVDQLAKGNRTYNEGLTASHEESESASEGAGGMDGDASGQRVEQNQSDVERDFAAASKPTNADEAISDSQKLGSGVLDGMAAMLAQGGERLLAAEYGARRFTSMDPRMLQTLLTGGMAQDAASELTSISNQQLEYILYGMVNPAGNLAAAYGELFALRLAIRTMEGLVESRGAGHPLLVLAMAGVYGLRQAIADIQSLAATGEAELSKYVPVRLTYLDYLRLFSLMHGSGNSQISRMIGLIEHRTGARLSEVSTGASVALQGSLPLWFLPRLTKLIGYGEALDGQVTGGRYEAISLAGWSY